MKKNVIKKLGMISLASAMTFTSFDGLFYTVQAADSLPQVDQAGYNVLGTLGSATIEKNKVTFQISTGERLRFTFLEDNMYRMYLAPNGEEFQEYPTPKASDHAAKMTFKPDADYVGVTPKVDSKNGYTIITTGSLIIEIKEADCLMKVKKDDGTVVFEESEPLKYKNGETVQTLKTSDDEYFYGGGTQNGRFSHKGKSILIDKTNTWVDNSVASPNPFYWSNKGYGIVRNTWEKGNYDFDSNGSNTVTTIHKERRYDAYVFVDDTPKDIFNDYYTLTGYPAELPEYASYLGHLNCYNRDYWLPSEEGKGVKLGDKWYKESQSNNGGERETLLGDSDVTAQQIIEDHKTNDMPIGWFLPNDGYGCGYGQATSQAGDLENLEDFGNYANANGLEMGLWTQSNLWPADPSNPQKGERNIVEEVKVGTHAVKTDVAWVGAGYSMALSGIEVAYNAITGNSDAKPNIVTLNGWAGTQRYGGIWTGDQSGGQWEYIRFHIPTYIGTSLSGQPNVGSDMDGIFGGANKIIQTRDFQWKAFTTYMLDMDGWGSNAKTPYALGEDSTSLNRAYLKLKARLMPYINTISHEATAKGGLPMLRAMFLEEENSYTLGTDTEYQYMWGDNFLVAPVYQETAMDAEGNDVRDKIYLPGTSDVWIDYFTGEQYRGNQILNNFDAPLWKLPVFVKNGSIIPMYPENNNPKEITEANTDGLDRSQRFVEFYPAGSTSMELYEDDGLTLGGAGSTTKITSTVADGNATLHVDKTLKPYTTMVKERSTEFIVNVSKAPTAVTGKVKGSDVTFTKVDTQEAYDNATGNVYFYNAAPSVFVKEYANEGSKFANIDATTTPKLYVKSAEKVDVTAYDFEVVVKGFENSQDLGVDEENKGITTPTNFTSPAKTDSTISLAWDAVEGATSYDLEVDGHVYRNIRKPEYVHQGLKFLTNHEYRVRAVNSTGYSVWSEKVSVQTADNPYRNAPELTVTWPYGDQWGKVAEGFDHNPNTMFHSTNPVTPDQMMVLDLGKAYDLDKFTYSPRDNLGNGRVKKMDIYASFDGIHYNKVFDSSKHAEWDFKQPDDMIETVDLTGVNARFLKLSVMSSVGGFFSASDMVVYKQNDSKGNIVGDANNSGIVDDNDLTFFENYVGLIPSDKDFEYSNALGNFDRNDVIDAYDISYVARMIGDPILKPETGVEGKIQIIPSKTDIKAGDSVTLQIYGIGMKNVNAFSVELPVDKTQFEVTSFGSPSMLTTFMRNFSKVREHNNGTFDDYIVFANVGNQRLINGSGNLATVTIKATKDFTWDTNATRAKFVGQDLSYTDGIIDSTVTPELPETKKILDESNISEVTFKNDTNPDGVIKPEDLWQDANTWKSALFDNQPGTAAEFKWYFADKDISAAVKLPTDFSIKLDQARPISSFKVSARDGGNGGLLTSKATAIKADGTRAVLDLGTKEGPNPEFIINDTITEIIFTPLTSTGKATGTQTGSEENRMLTLNGFTITEDSEVKATGIEFVKDSSDTHTYVGEIAEVVAKVSPDNVSNPFYEVTSSDSNIAAVIKIPTKTGYTYGIRGVSKGTVTLTATSLEKDQETPLKTTMEFEVKDGINADSLMENVKAARALSKALYEEATYNAVIALVEEAEAILADSPTQAKVDEINIKLVVAMDKLQYRGSDDSREDSINLIPAAGLKVASVTNYADSDLPEHIIDGDTKTIWHSKYQAADTLPVDAVIDLGAEYNLEQVDYLASQRSVNGHITRYQIEVSNDGENFSPIVQGTFENDGNSLKNPSEFKKVKFAPVNARFVKFIALESLGGTKNKYASIAELNFYGETEEVEVVDKTALKALIVEANAKVEKDYTAASWAIFKEALTWANGIDQKEDATKNDVDSAVERLTTAMNELEQVVDTSEARKRLGEAIDKLEKAKLDPNYQYVIQSVKDKVDTRLAIAKGVYANPKATNTELLTAWNDVTEIMHYLNFTGNKDEFKKLIDKAEAMDLSLYKEQGKEEFKAALADAKALYDDPDALDADITKMTSRLKMAMDSLIKIDSGTTEVNKDTLNKMIELTTGDYNNPSKFQAGAEWDAFVSAYDNAVKVAADANATQAQVNAAADTLLSTYGKIILAKDKADLSALTKFLETVKGLSAKDYSAADYKRIMEIADLVSEFLNKDNFSQAELNEILALIDEAQKIIDNNKLPAQTPSGSGSGSVNTGDTTSSTAASAAGLMVVAGVIMYSMKKKEEEINE